MMRRSRNSVARAATIWYNYVIMANGRVNVLDRSQLIAQLNAAARGEISAPELAAWAFDQFYAEEAGEVEFEPGYRRVIAAVLDDLMFADQPEFRLVAADLQQRVSYLQHAAPALDDDPDDSDDQS
jgi:hypothetical protein